MIVFLTNNHDITWIILIKNKGNLYQIYIVSIFYSASFKSASPFALIFC